jgi:hypothetical protein
MQIYVSLEDLTEEERRSMPKLVGIDLEWYLKTWVGTKTKRGTSFVEFIQEDIEILAERAKDEMRAKDGE